MTTVLTPDAARSHLRVGGEVSDQDLTDLIAAAEAALADHLGRPLVCMVQGWPSPEDVPAGVRHAIKLILTDLYENRCTPLADMTGVRTLTERHMKLSIG